jgi:uncharacterized protein DUF4304
MPSSKEMMKAVAQVAPQLKAAGFRRFGKDFNKSPEAGLIHVVGFQGSKWGDEFTVNLGVYVREVDQLFDDSWGRSKKAGVPGEDGAVKEYDCWLRARLGEIRAGGHDTWWKYGNVDAASTDIAARIDHDARPAFADVSSREGLIKWWRGRERGLFRWMTEPRASLGLALLLKRSGAIQEAQSVVDDICLSSLGRPFHNMVVVLAEEMGLECSDAI